MQELYSLSSFIEILEVFGIEKVYCVEMLMYKLYHLAAVSKNLLFSVLKHSQGYLIQT